MYFWIEKVGQIKTAVWTKILHKREAPSSGYGYLNKFL